MPNDFNTAFATARKQGLKVFTHGGKQYSTKYREEKALDDIISEYPALGKVYNAKNTRISMASTDRQELNKKYGGGGVIEHWFPDDEGAKEFPHPSLGKYNLEFFNQDTFKDTPTMKGAAFLDMLHGMKYDPGYRTLRDEFNQKLET